MKKPKLIPQWRRAWRMVSVQCMALAAAVQAAWPMIPEDVKATLPPPVINWVSLALLVAGILGRLVQQPKVHAPDNAAGMVHLDPWAGPPKE